MTIFRWIWLPFIAAAVLACDGKPLVGPEAQEAYLKAAELLPDLPQDVLVFVDGVEASSDTIFDVLRADQIERIEMIKGAAAAELYGGSEEHGVIQIFTKTN